MKHELYARHGVREFWVVDPGNRCVRVYHLDPVATPRRFGEPVIATGDERLVSGVLEGFSAALPEVFARLS